jgi:hypothetical protein
VVEGRRIDVDWLLAVGIIIVFVDFIHNRQALFVRLACCRGLHEGHALALVHILIAARFSALVLSCIAAEIKEQMGVFSYHL